MPLCHVAAFFRPVLQTFLNILNSPRIPLQVFLYRAGIVTSATCFILGALAAFVPSDSPLSPALRSALDPLAAIGAGSLGLSLYLVHMYVTPIKRFMQVCVPLQSAFLLNCMLAAILSPYLFLLQTLALPVKLPRAFCTMLCSYRPSEAPKCWAASLSCLSHLCVSFDCS